MSPEPVRSRPFSETGSQLPCQPVAPSLQGSGLVALQELCGFRVESVRLRPRGDLLKIGCLWKFRTQVMLELYGIQIWRLFETDPIFLTNSSLGLRMAPGLGRCQRLGAWPPKPPAPVAPRNLTEFPTGNHYVEQCFAGFEVKDCDHMVCHVNRDVRPTSSFPQSGQHTLAAASRLFWPVINDCCPVLQGPV